jgi:hypothetical protein
MRKIFFAGVDCLSEGSRGISPGRACKTAETFSRMIYYRFLTLH